MARHNRGGRNRGDAYVAFDHDGLHPKARSAITDLITCSGAFGATTWSVDAKHPDRWEVETASGAIRVMYSKPGMVLIFK